MADKKALGTRADLFATHISKHAHDMVVAVAAVFLQEQEGEEPTVAVVGVDSEAAAVVEKPGRGGSDDKQQVSHTVSHAEQAMLETELCFNHFCYGARANTCRAPCIWSRN